MRPRLLPVLLAASCALAACGGAKRQAEPAPPDLAPAADGAAALERAPARSAPRPHDRALAARPHTGRERDRRSQGAVEATCAKGTSASLKAFIRERLPDVDVAAAALFGRVVALIDAQCPLAPGQVLSLQSAALAELSLNGMRASARGAIPERELNERACAVMVAADRSVGQHRRRARAAGHEPRPPAPPGARHRRQGRSSRRARSGSATCAARSGRCAACEGDPRQPHGAVGRDFDGRRPSMLPSRNRRAPAGVARACDASPSWPPSPRSAPSPCRPPRRPRRSPRSRCAAPTAARRITAHAALQGLHGRRLRDALARGGRPVLHGEGRHAPRGDHAGGWTVQYLRAANLIRAEADYGKHVWTRPAGVTAAALRDAARGLQPYPAEKLGPVREPPPVAVEDPPARVSRPASGGGSSRLAAGRRRRHRGDRAPRRRPARAPPPSPPGLSPRASRRWPLATVGGAWRRSSARCSASELRILAILGVPTFALALAITTVSTYLPVLAEDFSDSTIVIGLLIGGEGLIALWLPLVVGSWSDRLRTPLGSRLPFILAATPALVARRSRCWASSTRSPGPRSSSRSSSSATSSPTSPTARSTRTSSTTRSPGARRAARRSSAAWGPSWRWSAAACSSRSPIRCRSSPPRPSSSPADGRLLHRRRAPPPPRAAGPGGGGRRGRAATWPTSCAATASCRPSWSPTRSGSWRWRR